MSKARKFDRNESSEGKDVSKLITSLKILNNNLNILEKLVSPERQLFETKGPTDLKGVLKEVEFMNSSLGNKVKLKKMELEHYRDMRKEYGDKSKVVKEQQEQNLRYQDTRSSDLEDQYVIQKEQNEDVSKKLDSVCEMLKKNQDLMRQQVLSIQDLESEVLKLKIQKIRKRKDYRRK